MCTTPKSSPARGFQGWLSTCCVRTATSGWPGLAWNRMPSLGTCPQATFGLKRCRRAVRPDSPVPGRSARDHRLVVKRSVRLGQKILSRGDRPGRFRLVLEVDSGELAPLRLAHEVVELVRGELAANAFAPYVGDAVALSVAGAHPGVVGQVDAHAVGGAQARALADQDGDHPGAEDLADFVAHGHAALFD